MVLKKKTTTRTTRSKKPKLSQLKDIKEGFAKSKDKTAIWYKSIGKGTPLVFCNGFGCSTFYFKHVASYFKKDYQVVLFDWRGHGQSELPKNLENVSIDWLMEDLNAVMKTLRLKKVVLIGHSMGAQVLYHYYEKHPDNVTALIPCFGTFGNPLDTFYNNPNIKYVFDLIYEFNHSFPNVAKKIGHLIKKAPLWYQMGSLLKMVNPGLVDKKVLREYIDHFTSVDPILWTKLLKNMQESNAEEMLSFIKIPTLIIAAEKDTFTPVWLSKKAHHLIRGSEILVIKKATHVGLIEQPALINLRIEKFLQQKGLDRPKSRTKKKKTAKKTN